MSEIKVSIVVPVYNTAEFIGETLACLTSQSLREIEIIVVDDGSTDDSLRIVRRAADADTRIRILVQENAGQSVARNNGLDAATGQYVYFMDSDDLLAPDAMEKCYEKCARENLDIVLFDADIFGDSGCFDSDYYHRTARLTDKTFTGAELFAELSERHAHRASVCLYLIRRSYLESIGLKFYPGIIHEDELFSMLLCIQAGRAGIIARAFFRRRFRSSSTMTTVFSMRNMRGYWTVADQALRFAAGCGGQERLLVREFVRKMINPAVCKAATLPLADRLKVLRRSAASYPGYITLRTAAVLLFKRPLEKLRGR